MPEVFVMPPFFSEPKNVKSILIVIGAIVAIVGTAVIDHNSRSAESTSSGADQAIAHARVLLARSADEFDQYLWQRHTINIMMAIFESAGIAHESQSITQYRERVTDMQRHICAAKDVTDRPTRDIERDCRLHPAVNVWTLPHRTLADLQAMRNTVPDTRDRLIYYGQRDKLQHDIVMREADRAQSGQKKLSWQNWQSVVAVIAILIALGKDLLPERKEG